MMLNENPKEGKDKEKAERFYKQLLDLLQAKHVRFLVSGTYAFTQYTGIERPTKDIDIITTEKEYPALLKLLTEQGYQTKLHEMELNWLAKVMKDEYFADVMFAERNGLHKVDESWFKNARDGVVLDREVKLVPPEELIRSKVYIQGRHNFGGVDAIHLILTQGKTLQWKLLFEKMEPHWEILAQFLFLFLFIYPSEREVIPNWVIENLMEKAKDRLSHSPTKDRITRGLLLSPDFEAGVSHWGFKPIKELK
jgi:hypothetical protein